MCASSHLLLGRELILVSMISNPSEIVVFRIVVLLSVKNAIHAVDVISIHVLLPIVAILIVTTTISENSRHVARAI